MVLLEAMASGTVVVASDIEGYRDAAGGHAVLVAPGDVEAWAGALEGVLAGRFAVAPPTGPAGEGYEGRQRWLAAAAARAEEWSMARLAECYEGLYLSAVAGPRG